MNYRLGIGIVTHFIRESFFRLCLDETWTVICDRLTREDERRVRRERRRARPFTTCRTRTRLEPPFCCADSWQSCIRRCLLGISAFHKIRLLVPLYFCVTENVLLKSKTCIILVCMKIAETILKKFNHQKNLNLPPHLSQPRALTTSRRKLFSPSDSTPRPPSPPSRLPPSARPQTRLVPFCSTLPPAASQTPPRPRHRSS